MLTQALTSEFKILTKKDVAAVKFDLSRRDLGEECTTELSRSLSESAAICCAKLPDGRIFVVDGAQRLRTLSCYDQVPLFEIVSVKNLLSAFDLAFERYHVMIRFLYSKLFPSKIYCPHSIWPWRVRLVRTFFVYLLILFCIILHHG